MTLFPYTYVQAFHTQTYKHLHAITHTEAGTLSSTHKHRHTSHKTHKNIHASTYIDINTDAQSPTHKYLHTTAYAQTYYIPTDTLSHTH